MSKKKNNRKRIEGYIPNTKTFKEKIDVLKIEDLDLVEDVDTKFKKLIIKFTNYLRNENFLISTDSILKFFKLYSSFNIFELEDIKYTLKMLIAKDKEQYDTFETHFESFFFGINEYKQQKIIDNLKEYLLNQRTSELLSEKDKKERELKLKFEQMEKEKEYKEKESELNKKKLESEKEKLKKENKKGKLVYRRKKETNEDELKEWFKKNNETLNNFIDEMKLLSQIEKHDLKKLLSLEQEELFEIFKEDIEDKFENLKKSLNQLMLENITSDNHSEINQLCLVASNMLTKSKAFIERKNKEFRTQLNNIDRDILNESNKMFQFNKELNDSQKTINKELTQYDMKIKDIEKSIEKEISLNHRPIFIEGKNSVKVKTNLDLMNSDIEKLTDNQYESLTDIIKANSSKFKTKLSRSMMRFRNKRFNYNKTMKNSLKTFGVPIELFYEKPKIKKTKVICILDVSGSCAKSSKLLLRFIYELSEVFKGGVKSYVFVKDLVDVSDFFISYHLNDAIENSLAAVPRTYSDYYHAFRTFDELYLGEVDKNTIVLFLGDARNNKNESGVEYIKAIKQKAKSLIWLNTEEMPKWNVNDSIIGLYSEYMNEVYEILTTMDLINFLGNFKIK